MTAAAWLQRRQIAVYAVAVALAAHLALGLPETAPRLARLVDPTIAVLLYVTFLEVPFVRFRRAFTDGRFVAAALALNFLVVPAVVALLLRFLPAQPALRFGALLVLLTPCIDYVVAFTGLAGGDAEQLTVTTPVLLVVQFCLLPVFLWAFLGERAAAAVEVGPFLDAFVGLVVLPLALAWLTEAWADRSARGSRWQAAMGVLPVPAMAATLFVVVASQLPRVRSALGHVAAVVPVYVAFFLVMVLLGWFVARALDVDAGRARALVFTGVTRNSLVVLPLALALPSAHRLAPAAVVTQTLVELLGMLVLVRVVPAILPD